jgi:hypothetical protein
MVLRIRRITRDLNIPIQASSFLLWTISYSIGSASWFAVPKRIAGRPRVGLSGVRAGVRRALFGVVLSKPRNLTKGAAKFSNCFSPESFRHLQEPHVFVTGADEGQANGDARDIGERYRDLRQSADAGDGREREGSAVEVAVPVVAGRAFERGNGGRRGETNEVALAEGLVQFPGKVLAFIYRGADLAAILLTDNLEAGGSRWAEFGADCFDPRSEATIDFGAAQRAKCVEPVREIGGSGIGKEFL